MQLPNRTTLVSIDLLVFLVVHVMNILKPF